MNEVGHYIRVHLMGAAAGIDLFALSGRRITDPEIRDAVRSIHGELVDERRRLVRMVEGVGASEPRLLSLLTVVDEHEALDRDELQWLLAQGEAQHDRLTAAHRTASSRALSPGDELATERVS